MKSPKSVINVDIDVHVQSPEQKLNQSENSEEVKKVNFKEVKKVKIDHSSTAVGRRKPLRDSSSVRDLHDLHDVLETPQRPIVKLNHIWEYLFASVAFIDILSTFLPPILRERDARARALKLEEEERRKILPKFLTFWKKDPGSILELAAEQCVDGFKCMCERFIYWMEDNRVLIAWTFCICWVIDSLLKAYLASISESDVEQSLSHEAKKRNRVKLDDSSLSRSNTPRLNACTVKKLLFRLSLLPIGFYMLSLVDHLSIVESLDSNSTDQSPKDESGHLLFSETERYCLLFSIVLQFKAFLGLFLKNQIVYLTTVVRKKIIPRILRFAILKPRLFKGRMQSLLASLRWLKYLIPLFQKFEKIFKTFLKIIKIKKQRAAAAAAKKERQKVWNMKTEEERMISAATRVQSNFRMMKARRETKMRMLISKARNKKASASVIKVLRARAVAAKAEVRRKKNELHDLKTKTCPTVDDKHRSNELRHELKVVYKKNEKRKMLLRPDTKFLIAWKVMFMICIAIEMAHKAFQSKTTKQMDDVASLEYNIESIFIPEPIENWDSCTNSTNESRGLLRLLTAPTVDSQEVAWYCHTPYTTFHLTYIHFIQFFIRHGLSCMSMILFLDVFVNFFVGEYDENGFLVPSSFVHRWIFPGIGFQLLVNPRLKDVSALVKSVLHQPGPARVCLWLVAFLIPISAIILDWLKWNFWMVLVAAENRKTSGEHKSKPPQKQVAKRQNMLDSRKWNDL